MDFKYQTHEHHGYIAIPVLWQNQGFIVFPFILRTKIKVVTSVDWNYCWSVFVAFSRMSLVWSIKAALLLFLVDRYRLPNYTLQDHCHLQLFFILVVFGASDKSLLRFQ